MLESIIPSSDPSVLEASTKRKSRPLVRYFPPSQPSPATTISGLKNYSFPFFPFETRTKLGSTVLWSYLFQLQQHVHPNLNIVSERTEPLAHHDLVSNRDIVPGPRGIAMANQFALLPSPRPLGPFLLPCLALHSVEF
jgi:hypothetical protein